MGTHLGEYVEAGEYEGRPSFKQRDTEGSVGRFLYSAGGKWRVSATLGGSRFNLINNQDTPLPPNDQWLYWNGDTNTMNDDDTSLTLEFTALSPCQLITVAGQGDVGAKQGDQLGDYG